MCLILIYIECSRLGIDRIRNLQTVLRNIIINIIVSLLVYRIYLIYTLNNILIPPEASNSCFLHSNDGSLIFWNHELREQNDVLDPSSLHSSNLLDFLDESFGPEATSITRIDIIIIRLLSMIATVILVWKIYIFTPYNENSNNCIVSFGVKLSIKSLHVNYMHRKLTEK